MNLRYIDFEIPPKLPVLRCYSSASTMSASIDIKSAPPSTKPIHSLVLDTGPLIKNDPPASSLLAKAEKLYILPSIIFEIRDEVTRSRVETTLLPFVTLRSPKPDSIKVIQDFARRTGDLQVMSKPDIQVLALGYELELERNNGDWRLRKMPGQKTLNGRPPVSPSEAVPASTSEEPVPAEGKHKEETESQKVEEQESIEQPVTDMDQKEPNSTVTLEGSLDNLQIESPQTQEQNLSEAEVQEDQKIDVEEASDSDSDGWITPSNIKKHQNKATEALPAQPVQKTLQAAILTSDFAMQNVALRMNLNLVAPSFTRITHLKNWVLRCHGCFQITKDMAKQFCPSCGQATLTRTSCSTDDRGNFKVHLKKNFQWNNRGNVYSVPKPVHGTSNGKLQKNAGGQGGWGSNLILAEDQKEYVRASDEQRRTRKKDLMDEDYLPSILTGERGGNGGRIKVGAGKNVNSRRKR